jgi:hypothetical protein
MKTKLLSAAVCAALVAGCKTVAPPSPQASQPAPTSQPPNASVPPALFVIDAPDKSCEITIDTSKAPDLTDWADHKLAPVLADWYPKISALLPSAGYTPPIKWSVVIAPGDGVAATSGTRVTANAIWLRGQLNKQGVGAIVHEEVHVIQQYGGGRRNNPPGSFSLGDITNLFSLAQKLRENSDPISAFVSQQMTPPERKALADYRGPGPRAYVLRTNLVGALNRIVKGPSIYGAALFKNVTLRESTLTLRDEKPDAEDLPRLNRALLEDAFPGDLAHRGSGGRNRGNTGWLTEGIPDYIRWFLYEPQSHGADATYIEARIESGAKKDQPYQPKYNDSYRISANFLHFVSTKYNRHIITKLNDALRQGKYYDDIWADDTGKTVQDLSMDWLAVVYKEIAKIKPKPAVTAPASAKT